MRELLALRNGFTTGTAATAAAMAAALFAFKHISVKQIQVPLPPFEEPLSFLSIPIEKTGVIENGLAYAEVIKDGGDDPDATHGMIIRADIYGKAESGLTIDGGEGIGRVTLPGLPVSPGEAAINPVPRQQITFGVSQIVKANLGLQVVISAPEGIERAKKTMNARLGIVGGISILGTQGIVRPFSNAAYKASIAQALNVAKAADCENICLATGRRSLDFLKKLYPHLGQQSFVVAGDFVQESLALAKNFKNVSWGCFFGKLVKLAQGMANTHAHMQSLDFRFLSEVLEIPDLQKVTTAQSVLEIAGVSGGLMRLMRLARHHAEQFAGRRITIHLFDTAGRELARV